MGFRRWVGDTRRSIARDGFVAGGIHSAREPWTVFLRNLPLNSQRGENIADRDWDICVILDACRADMFEQAFDRRDQHMDTIWSVGSMTGEWMENTFIEKFSDVWRETTYICANPHSETTLDHNRFKEVKEVWKHAWNEEDGTVYPRPVTDAAIRAGRDGAKRLLIHYMQPHYPFVGANDDFGVGISRQGFGRDRDNDVWTLCSRGQISREQLWQGYRSNLEFVLDDIDILTKNLDGSLVITSDHGNAVGEWGIYGHPRGVNVSSLRKVPWVTIEAKDKETYIPSDKISQSSDKSVEERLSALGYN